ncbi:uncharacterized protein LOC126816562 [Patella vulgata]|uniref:uncharacterized protein LOC126816562 n=1 Tax=Patella vulgata TaxID=6465 RepID=UPI00218051F2|nr:uncharacterized protein LOC126816562 [Patella vulgata]
MSCIKPTIGENVKIEDNGETINLNINSDKAEVVYLNSDGEGNGKNIDADRLKTENLLNIDDFQSSLSIVNDTICSEDWSEAVCGWKSLPPYPKYVTGLRKRKTVDQESNGVVKCVNDDDSDHHLKPWRASVEPTTFRYVPNNGKYRLDKFSQVGRDWYTIRKIKPEKVPVKEPEPKQTRESRSQKRISRKKPEVRSRSTNSDGALVRPSLKCTLNVEPDNIRPLLSKSATDLFMESLDSKLNQLEYSVKKNMKNPKQNIFESPSGSENGKNKKGNSVTFSADLHKETSSIASNTVSNNLRPLEKVTPKQRIKIGIGKSESKSKANGSTTTTYINNHTSIAFEGIDSEQLQKFDNTEKFDSYLLGKGKHIITTGKPSASSVKKKSAILKYTTTGSHRKSLDKLWNPSNLDGNALESDNIAELPEVSGKRIPVTFTSQRLLKQ